MKPPPFHYHDPGTVEEAVALIGSLENAKLLAGGQSLMPMLNMRYVLPDHIVDLNRITGLSHIDETDGRIVIGAMTRQREIEHSDLLQQRCPLFRKALLQVGHRQTRNRGTIGGSLCHLDPAAELPAVLTALQATVHVVGAHGARDIAIADFPAFYMTPAIEFDELVSAVSFSPWPIGHKSAFVEFARRPGDFAIVGVAALMDAADNGMIHRATISLSGVGAAPVRCTATEEQLIGTKPDEISLRVAAETCRELDAMEDVHASPSYRQHLAVELVSRAVQAALDDAGAGSTS